MTAVVLPVRRRPVAMLLLVWLVVLALGGLALRGAVSVGGRDPLFFWALLLSGLLLTVAGLVLVAGAVRTLAIGDALIELDENGFLDRRLLRAKLPWAAMRWHMSRRGRAGVPSLQFSVAAGAQGALRRGPDLAVHTDFPLCRFPARPFRPGPGFGDDQARRRDGDGRPGRLSLHREESALGKAGESAWRLCTGTL